MGKRGGGGEEERERKNVPHPVIIYDFISI